MNNTTRLVLLLILSFATRHPMQGQTTSTSTNCNVYGTTANCTSTSTDDSALKAQQSEQQRQAYETGQKIGATFGQAMQSRAFSKSVRRYCDAHPGENWHNTNGSSGHCPSDDDKASISSSEFLAHHKDFIRNAANAQTLVSYIEANKLDPRERTSYDKAYKQLKKEGRLELYAK